MNKPFITVLAAAATLLFHAQAATNFTDADGANSFISTAGNWDNGLPVGQLGTISQDTGYDSNAGALVNYQIVQTDGTFSRLSGLGALSLDGSSWEMNGATAAFSTTVRGMTLTNSASFTLTDGTYNQENNRDVTLNSGSSITVNGGAFNAGRSIRVNGTTTFTINAGTASTTGTFGQGGFITGAGTINMNGGTLTGDRFVFQQNGTVATFGGTSSGSATFADWGTGNGLGANGDRQDDRKIDLNFLAGTLMSLTMESTTRELDFDDDTVGDAGAAWAEALWGTGQLKYTDGATVVAGFDPDPETNGWSIVSWADATNSAVGFGTASSEYFVWTAAGSFGGALSLGDTGGAPSEPLLITSFEAVSGQPGVFEVGLSGTAGADFIFRSAADLDFSSGSVVENLVAVVPAVGTIGGTNNSVVTTDGGGNATVRMTLTGDPADFVRAEDAP